jgi:hypothetical protein
MADKRTIIVEIDFDYGEVVFCKTDTYQTPGFVTGIIARPGSVKYEVNWVGMKKEFYGFELSKEKNITGEIPTANNGTQTIRENKN